MTNTATIWAVEHGILAGRLHNPSLFNERAYIDGRWCDAEDGRAIEVTDPASGKVIGTVPNLGVAETRAAIAAAQKAQAAWRRLLPAERGDFIRRWADLMRENKEDQSRH
jgi:acyl-CoA reductase-like NAD-dependent aldehyde dehydrogenase